MSPKQILVRLETLLTDGMFPGAYAESLLVCKQFVRKQLSLFNEEVTNEQEGKIERTDSSSRNHEDPDGISSSQASEE